jgi:hypothetical protein
MLAAVFVLYRQVLSLPLYWDDARHYFMATEHSLLDIWLNHTGFAYYRPAMFTLYRLAFTYLTPSLTWLCYALAVAAHGANSILAGHLASRLAEYGTARPARQRVSPRLVRYLASFLFLAFPFALYVAANFAAAMHLVVMALSLIGALAALRYLETRSSRWLALTIGAAVVAPFFHEVGVVLGPLFLFEILIFDRGLAWERRRVMLWLLVAPVLFMIVWVLVPKVRAGPVRLGDLPTLRDNLSFFVQGLTFPVQGIAGRLAAAKGWGSTPAIWAVALPALCVAAVSMGWSGQFKTFVLSLGWFMLISLPSVLLLPTWYTIPAPRLLYACAVPAVLMCTGTLSALSSLLGSLFSRAARPVASATFVGLVAATFVLPVTFTLDKLALFQVALAPVKQLAALAREYPGERQLVINPADWVASSRDPYPLGSLGVSILPDYVTLNEVVTINSGRPAQFDGVYYPAIRGIDGDTGYTWAPYHEDDGWDAARLAASLNKYARVWVTRYLPGHIEVEHAGNVMMTDAAEPDAYLARFEDGPYLLSGGYTVKDGALVLTLDWQETGAGGDATVFRHILDCAGQTLAIADGSALGRTLPFGVAQPGSVIHDRRVIPLASPPADGCYSVEVGLYRADGTRLKVAAAGSGTESVAVGSDVVHIGPAKAAPSE